MNRGTPNDEKPFAWQSKTALRKIRDSFDAEKAVASALGVYFALTEIASDMQSEIFQTTHAYIAQKSGLSPRTVQDRLAGLAEIGLVEIETPKLKAPSTYRLLSVQQPLPDVRQRTKKASLPSLEESKEELYEERKDVMANAIAPSSLDSEKTKIPTKDEVREYGLSQGLDSDGIEVFLFEREMIGWVKNKGGEKIHDWKRFLMGFCLKYEHDRTG